MDNTIDGCETNRQKNMYVEGVIKNSQTPMILIPFSFSEFKQKYIRWTDLIDVLLNEPYQKVNTQTVLIQGVSHISKDLFCAVVDFKSRISWCLHGRPAGRDVIWQGQDKEGADGDGGWGEPGGELRGGAGPPGGVRGAGRRGLLP